MLLGQPSGQRPALLFLAFQFPFRSWNLIPGPGNRLPHRKRKHLNQLLLPKTLLNFPLPEQQALHRTPHPSNLLGRFLAILSTA